MKIEIDGIEMLDAPQAFDAAHPMFKYLVGEVPENIASLMAKYENFIVVGMGGSVLPLKVFVKAFRLESRIHFLDGLDRKNFEALLKLPKALFCVASKSGETLEIKALLNELLIAGKGKDLLVATDSKSGFLRGLVNQQEWPSLEIPSELGGRFTNFTIFHRALLESCGLSFAEILKAAAQKGSELKRDSKILSHLHQSLFASKKNKLVLWAYGEKFVGMAEWLQQIIAESLGKKTALGESVGIFPIVLKGPQDQHSVLQLLMEGPQDFSIWFLDEIANPAVEKSKNFEAFAELKGISLEGLQRVFCEAIYQSFKERLSDSKTKCPLVRIQSDLSPKEVGELVATFQALIEYSGVRLKINAFDQPGVERGKVLARELLKNR